MTFNLTSLHYSLDIPLYYCKCFLWWLLLLQLWTNFLFMTGQIFINKFNHAILGFLSYCIVSLWSSLRFLSNHKMHSYAWSLDDTHSQRTGSTHAISWFGAYECKDVDILKYYIVIRRSKNYRITIYHLQTAKTVCEVSVVPWFMRLYHFK